MTGPFLPPPPIINLTGWPRIYILTPMENFHRISNVDVEARTGVCSICGPVKVKIKRNGQKGKFTCWTRVCEQRKRQKQRPAEKARRKEYTKKRNKELGRSKSRKYRKHVKMTCERCGFEAKHPSLIDGHHRDGNRKNNSPENIASLCAICHRIEHLPADEKISLIPAAIVKKDDSKDLVKKLLEDNERLEKELAKARKEAEDNLLASDDERLVSARVEFRKLRDRLIKYEEMYGSA